MELGHLVTLFYMEVASKSLAVLRTRQLGIAAESRSNASVCVNGPALFAAVQQEKFGSGVFLVPVCDCSCLA